MPPDWAAHTRCWMAWPCRESSWGAELDEARLNLRRAEWPHRVPHPVAFWLPRRHLGEVTRGAPASGASAHVSGACVAPDVRP